LAQSIVALSARRSSFRIPTRPPDQPSLLLDCETHIIHRLHPGNDLLKHTPRIGKYFTRFFTCTRSQVSLSVLRRLRNVLFSHRRSHLCVGCTERIILHRPPQPAALYGLWERSHDTASSAPDDPPIWQQVWLDIFTNIQPVFGAWTAARRKTTSRWKVDQVRH